MVLISLKSLALTLYIHNIVETAPKSKFTENQVQRGFEARLNNINGIGNLRSVDLEIDILTKVWTVDHGGLPDGLANQLNNPGRKGIYAEHVAFGPNGAWYVKGVKAA